MYDEADLIRTQVPAIEGYPLNSDSEQEHSREWDIFIERILNEGYLLPGIVSDLGRPSLSWIVQWPEDGFKSTAVFNSLQYFGRLRIMNNIPPIDLYPSGSAGEVSVVMTDDSKYTVSPDDLERITSLTPGGYVVQEATPSKRGVDLEVLETAVNGKLYQAIQMTKVFVQKVNSRLANPKRSLSIKNRLQWKSFSDIFPMKGLSGSGRLTKNVAKLGPRMLATAYKVEGRKISRMDAVRNMDRDIQYLKGVISVLEDRWNGSDHRIFVSDDKRELRQGLDNIRRLIVDAEQRRARDVLISG